MGMGAQLKRYKALNPGENHARAAAGGRGCTQAGVALHMHTPTHTYPCTCTCTHPCTCTPLMAARGADSGAARGLLRVATAGSLVAGWSTIGPPRELAVLHVASTSVLRHQGRVARCLQEAVSRKSPGARHAAYLARAWVGVRSKSAASVVCVRPACCCSIRPSGCRSAGWSPGAAARGAASRARGASGAAGRGRGTTRPSTSGGAHQAAAPHGLSPEVGAA